MNKVYDKKVLFIAYTFPPVGGGGVQRSVKFVKYLPHFGWIPLVLTVKNPYDYHRDETLENDISEKAVIYRTYSIDLMKWVRKLLNRKSKKWLQKKGREIPEQSALKKSVKPGFLVTLKTYVFVPDNEILWLPFAVWKGLRIIRKEKPQVIYSTASPFTDHLAGLILSRLAGLPWVADFRDTWVKRANFPQNRWRLFIDGKLEKLVLSHASQVLTATGLMAEDYQKIQSNQKYTVITNGYDELDFTAVGESPPSTKEFRITYTGIFNREQSPVKFFLALEKLINAHEKFRKRFKLRMIGQLDNPGDFENFNVLEKLNLNKYSEVMSYKPHKQVIKEIQQATVLFLLVGEYPNNKGVLTGKIFEYLRAKRPILAIVPEKGAAADIIRDTNSGLVVANDNVDDIASGIRYLFDLFIKGELNQHFSYKNIEKYERKKLTHILVKVLMELS